MCVLFPCTCHFFPLSDDSLTADGHVPFKSKRIGNNMADFVETDSPLPTPTLQRKFSGDIQNPKTPPFVRKGCFRRKGGGKAEGSSQKKGDARGKGRNTRKGQEKDGVVVTSYRKLCHTLTSSLINTKDNSSPAVITQEPRSPASGSITPVTSTNGSGDATPTHTIAQTRPRDTKTQLDGSTRTGRKKQHSSGDKPLPCAVLAGSRPEKSHREDSEEEENVEEANVVGLSFKKISDTDTQFEADTAQPNAVTCREQNKESGLMQTQYTRPREAPKAADHKNGGQADIRSVRPIAWAEPWHKLDGTPSGHLGSKSAAADQHMPMMLRRHPNRNSERKFPNTPERSVAVLRRGSLQDRYFLRWSTFTDIDLDNAQTYDEEKAGASPCRMCRESMKDGGSRCHRDTDEKPQRCEGSGHSTCDVTKPPTQPAAIGEGNLAETLKSNDFAQHQEVTVKKALVKLSVELGRKSEKSIFDNLVSVCSETMASSIRQCQAESPDEGPAKMTDVGREQGALLFGDIMKEFVARLPSDADQIQTSLPSRPPVCEKISSHHQSAIEEPSDTLKVMQEAIQKACDGLMAAQLPQEPSQTAHSSPIPEPRDAPIPVGSEPKTNTFVLPSFAKMEESKVLSRRNSVDLQQEPTRIRLSKTGRIEVLDTASVTDDDEDHDDAFQDSSRPHHDPPPAAESPPVTKRRPSFVERLSQWRLSWNFKHDSSAPPQPLPVRSESLKLRAHQRRASVPNFPSRRFSFSGTFSDLHYSIQSQKESSIAEAPPTLKVTSLFQQSTSATANRRRGSVSSCLTLAPPEADSGAVRRSSFDDRLKKGTTQSVDNASDAFSYFLDYPVLQLGEWASFNPFPLYLHALVCSPSVLTLLWTVFRCAPLVIPQKK